MITHIGTGGDYYTIRVEIRPGRDFEAKVPKDVMPLELSVFLHRVREVIQRKWKTPGPGGDQGPDDAGPVRGHG